MTFVVRTYLDVARWIAVQTLLATICVLPATAIAVWWNCDGVLSTATNGYAMLRFCLVMAFVETALFCPIVAFRSISLLRELNLARDELERLAHTDQLTGLLNRRGFHQAAARALSAARASGGRVAVLMCDIDSFKKINDEFGHDFGDVALQHVANLLRAVAGQGESVLGRQGGEEFVVLLPRMARREDLALAESLREACATQPVEWNAISATMTMSIGLAIAQSCADRVDSLVALADKALYEAKRNGRDRVAMAGEPFANAA